MTFNLHKDLASSGWHSSIITTYSVDPAFYDNYVERRLRANGVKNNILMADERMLKVALNGLPESFIGAGVRYAVVPVGVTGAFHPKIHLRIGDNKARLVIGSANVTAAGWGKNLEVVTRLDWSWRERDTPDNAALGQLVAKAYSYLSRWLDKTPGEALRYKKQMIERQAQWLREIAVSKTPVTLSDGSAADLLCESGGDTPSMLKQFSDLMKQEKVRRLVVVSPYWDTDLRGLRDLRTALGNPPTVVALNPVKNAFPVGALGRRETLKFAAIDEATSAKFVHAKIFIAETAKVDHVLFGSANCSDDAIGYLGGRSRNAEVSVYRRLPRGHVLEGLGLDLSNVVSRAAIRPPVSIPLSAETKKRSVPAGVIELRDRMLTWWPPESLAATNAVIELGGVSLAPCEGPGGKWHAEFTGKVIPPLIARVHYENGMLSDPVVVHFETHLRKAAPGQIDPRLNEALDKARGPEGDLLELAAQARIIFEPVARKIVPRGAGSRTGKRGTTRREVFEYNSEDEFRNAMKLGPGTGKTGRTDEDDPGFQDLFAIISRGIVGTIPQEDMDFDEQDKGLLFGDAEDDADELQDDETGEGDDEQKTLLQQNTSPTVVKKVNEFTVADVLRRRKQLVTALDLFDAMLDRLKKDPSLVTSRLAVQTMFVFRLMRYGVAHIHQTSDGGPRKLMVMHAVSAGLERRLSFILRSAWTLAKIWTGGKSIASQIRLDLHQTELPDDIYGFIVVSRWAITRAYLEAKNTGVSAPDREDSLLTTSLGKLAREIYSATLAMGPVDKIEEEKTIAELDSDIGCTLAQTKELLQCLRDFGKVQSTPRISDQQVKLAKASH